MPAPTPITVVVAQFEDLIARGLSGVIGDDASVQIVADNVEHGRVDVILRAHRPRVVILDGDALPKLAEVGRLSRTHPGTRLVLLVARPTPAECSLALSFGASAYLGRDTQGRDVLTAIHLASRGLQLIPRSFGEPGASAPLGAQLLTQREAEVLPMLQQGSSNAQIAAALFVGVETVRTHARNIYRKLGISSRRELAALPDRAAEANALAPVAHSPHRRVTPVHERQRRPGSLRS